jgi:diguanylate cyclase (GGDEF)-like protein/PAS domain S-box-containing protein/putative nucleotidyltransferase with HDIG domain
MIINENYKFLFNKVITGILILDLEGKIVYANPALEELVDIPLIQSKGTSFRGYVTKESLPKANEAFSKAAKNKVVKKLEVELIHRDGSIITTECNAIPFIENEKQIGVLVCFHDITDYKKALKKLQISEERYKELFENANDAIFIADPKTGQLLDANKQAEKLIGRPKEEIRKMHQSQLHPEDKREHYIEQFKKDVQVKSTQIHESEVISKDGKIIPVAISASVIQIDNKEVIQGIFTDLSELKRLEEEKKQAERSSLIDFHTQLYNYRYLQRRLTTEFSAAKRYLIPLSLIMIDIDYFKSINDTYGHQFGDEVLRQFAKLLLDNARESDIVCRFGGEEFIIILPNTDRLGSKRFAGRLQRIIKDYNFKSITSKYSVKLKVSMGLVSYPEDGMKTSSALLDCADKALADAKEKASGSIRLYCEVGQDEIFGSIIEEAAKQRIEILRRKFANLSRRMNQTIMESVYALAKTVGARDDYTERHSEEMAEYVSKIAKRLSLTNEEIENIRNGAMLHDIGKIGIKDEILLKPVKLTEKELKEVRKHPEIGADIIRQVHFLKNVVPIILYHHERYDGFGYGSGLRGEEIPIGARIIAIVDTYQALISDRPYRGAYSKKEAVKIVRDGAGSFFDPKIVEVFLDILKQEK